MPSPTLWTTHPERWLAAIVESSDDAIVGKTLDSVIRSWNAGAARIFGYSAKEIIGQSVLMLIPPELRDEEVYIASRLSRGERVDPFETVRLRKDGSRIEVSLSISPICDDHDAVVGAAKVARDITEANRLRRIERRMAEQLEQAKELEEQAVELEQQIDEAQGLQEELEQTNEELNRALEEARVAKQAAESANHAKSQFLTTMSHELRTPLNAIVGYVDLLELGLHGPLTDAQRQDLARLKQNQGTLLRLIQDVLDFAKIESGRVLFETNDIPLNELLHSLEVFVAPMLAKKRLEYHFAPCEPPLTVRGDREKVQQIMLNLLSNAAKFTDRGRIDVCCERRGDSVEIQARDTGRGIQPEQIESIFEAFVQGEQHLTRTAEGTGLGLAISRRFARAMGGDVRVTSEPGRGSTFILALPLGLDRDD